MALKQAASQSSIVLGYYMRMQFHICEIFNEDTLSILRILIDYTEYMSFIALVLKTKDLPWMHLLL